MKFRKYIAAVIATVSLSVAQASTNYQAQVQAQESSNKSLSAVAIAKEATEQQRLKTLEVLSTKFNGDQALTAYIAEVLAGKIGRGTGVSD